MFTKKASSTVDPSFWPSKRAFLFRPAGAVKELWTGCSPGSGGEIFLLEIFTFMGHFERVVQGLFRGGTSR